MDLKFIIKKIQREIKHERFKHLVEAQMPFSFPQLQRLDRSLQDKRLLTKSKYDEYGQTYEFGDEFTGLFGFRAVAANPGRTMKYKVADYQARC